MIDQMIESENKILIMISVSHVLDTPTNNQMINNKLSTHRLVEYTSILTFSNSSLCYILSYDE
jgi:hypothetical protein